MKQASVDFDAVIRCIGEARSTSERSHCDSIGLIGSLLSLYTPPLPEWPHPKPTPREAADGARDGDGTKAASSSVELGGLIIEGMAPMRAPVEAPTGTIECPTCHHSCADGLNTCSTCGRGALDRSPRSPRDEQMGAEGATGRTYEGQDAVEPDPNDRAWRPGSAASTATGTRRVSNNVSGGGAAEAEGGDDQVTIEEFFGEEAASGEQPFTVGALVRDRASKNEVVRVVSVGATSPPTYTTSEAIGEGGLRPDTYYEGLDNLHADLAPINSAEAEAICEKWNKLVELVTPTDVDVDTTALKEALDAFGGDLGAYAREYFEDELIAAKEAKQEAVDYRINELTAPDPTLIDCSALEAAIKGNGIESWGDYDDRAEVEATLQEAKKLQSDPQGTLVYYCGASGSKTIECVLSVDGDFYSTCDALCDADQSQVRARSALSSISVDTEGLESEDLDDVWTFYGADVLKQACFLLRSPPDDCSLETRKEALDIVTKYRDALVPASFERAKQLYERESAAEAFGRNATLVFTTDKPEHAAELCKVLKKAIKAGASYVQITSAPDDGVATVKGLLMWAGAESELDLMLGKPVSADAKRVVTSFIPIAEFKTAVARFCELDKKEREMGYELTLRYNSIKLVAEFDRRASEAPPTPKMTREMMLSCARADPKERSPFAVHEPPGKSLPIRTNALLALKGLIGEKKYRDAGLADVVWSREMRAKGKKEPLPPWLELRKADGTKMQTSLCTDFGHLHRLASKRCKSHDIVYVKSSTDHRDYYLVTKPGCPFSELGKTGSEAFHQVASKMTPQKLAASESMVRKRVNYAEIANKMNLLLASGETCADTGELIPDLRNLLPETGTGDAVLKLRGALAEYSGSRKTKADLGKVAAAWKAFSKAARKEKEEPVVALEEATDEAMEDAGEEADGAEDAEDAEEEVEGVEEEAEEEEAEVTEGVTFRLPTNDDVETRTTDDSPELHAAFGAECRILPGVYVVPNFVQTTLKGDPKKGDPKTILDSMTAKYPVRRGGDAIVPNEVQWVDGSHEALHYRGHPIARRKIWAQRGDPTSVGYRRYGYTGWQWDVLPATVDVAKISEITPVLKKYDEWCGTVGIPLPNHYIFTLYEDGTHSIDWHYDKTPDIEKGSIITVLKLGEHARPFGLRKRLFLKASFKYVEPTDAPKGSDERKELERQLTRQKNALTKLQAAPELVVFNKDVAPGSAIFMTLQANEYTQHAVLPTPADETGSVVLRSISTIFPLSDKRIANKRKSATGASGSKRARV